MPVSKAAAALRAILKPAPPPMTQQTLAEKLGVTQQAVSSWLRGITRPEYETRMEIAALLPEVAVDDWKVEPETSSDDVVVAAADEARPTGT